MPRLTYNSLGIGTDLFGRQDYWPDGSYLTTKFVVLLLIPTWPIRTLRVKPIAFRSTRLGLSRQKTTTEYYELVAEGPVAWSQVIRVYALTITFALELAAAVAFCLWAALRPIVAGAILMLAFVIPPLTLHVLRDRTRRRVVQAQQPSRRPAG